MISEEKMNTYIRHNPSPLPIKSKIDYSLNKILNEVFITVTYEDPLIPSKNIEVDVWRSGDGDTFSCIFSEGRLIVSFHIDQEDQYEYRLKSVLFDKYKCQEEILKKIISYTIKIYDEAMIRNA